MKRLAAAVALAVVMAGGGVGLVAQETRSATLLTTEHWLDWERVNDAQISPDGSRIVYTRQHVNKLEDKWDSELWIVNADGSQHRFLVKGGAPRWSPDGKRLLYQGEGEPKGSQLFVRWVDADGPATQITHISEAPRNAKWSPDGKSIAFSMFVPETEKWTISMPPEPKGAKWTPAPRVDEHHYVGATHFFRHLGCQLMHHNDPHVLGSLEDLGYGRAHAVVLAQRHRSRLDGRRSRWPSARKNRWRHRWQRRTPCSPWG
jgi:hypothetical protein